MTTQEFLQIAVSPIATILTGLAAFWIYHMQKKGEMQRSARTLWLNLMRSEDMITLLKKSGEKIEECTASVLSNDAWRQAMNNVSSKMSIHDVQYINNFFTHCEHVEKTMSEMKMLLLEHYRQRVHAVETTWAKEMILDAPQIQIKPQLRQNLDSYSLSTHQFHPKHLQEIFLTHLRGIQFISNTPCGDRLKKLAGLK